MTTMLSANDFEWDAEKRCKKRQPVFVPAIVLIERNKHSVRVLNVTVTGAMIETSFSFLQVGFKLRFQCGNITAEATVAWQINGRAGIKFQPEVTDRDVSELLSRSSVMADRHALRSSR